MSATPERNAALMLALWRTVEEIDNATPGELTATVKYARAIASDFVQPATQRAIWRRLAVVLEVYTIDQWLDRQYMDGLITDEQYLDRASQK